MKEVLFNPGDKVEIQTREKSFEGHALESYDSEIVLLKLKNGYNVGIREREIIGAKVLEKAKDFEKKGVELKRDKNLKNVAMIITGGTISSRLDPKSGGVISTDAEEILNIAPEISGICNVVKIEKPFMKFSEDMDPKDWIKISEVVAENLNDSDVDGIIVTHGTDTLHYTSAALSFFLGKLNKPVALTYSQRSVDRGSTDAALNLICAAKFAVSDIAEVALVGHENTDDLSCLAMPGTKVRKLHTSKRDAFKMVNSEPLARISDEGIDYLDEFNARNDSRVKIDSKFENKIAILKVYPGADPSVIDYYLERGYKGLVVETSGLGQVPGSQSVNNWLPKLKKAINSGVVVCATAQTIFGRLNPNVYSSGRELKKTGMIFLQDMLTETAFVKLGWILGHKSWAKTSEIIEEKMLENFSRELNDKIKN